MGPEVWNSLPVSFFLLGHAGSLGVMAGYFALEGFDFHLGIVGCFCQGGHLWFLCLQVVGVFGHLGCEFHVGSSEVSHFRPVLPCCLVYVSSCLLYPV